MRITKRQLRRIIREATLMQESRRTDAWRQGKYDEIGMEWDEPHDDPYFDLDYRQPKTTYVGATSLQPMIDAAQDALAAKPNSFLQSVLDQMMAGRMPSAKQKSIVKRIIVKHDPNAASLFESSKNRFR